MKIPELLLPAGSLEKLKIAYNYGADAVYCGVPRYSLRARENEFTIPLLAEGVELARSLGKKIYFTINSIPRNSKLPSYPKFLTQMAELKPDAFIMADPGLIYITKENHPEIDIHISVQANTMNYAAVKFWQKIGATRVILSREVSIGEVSEIKQHVPDMELEVFVHGSICIAHSGRCFMSNYYKQRDANQGSCNNACRDSHKVFVTNPRQNNELMELTESEEGTFLMNSKDLRAIEYLDEIIKAGVDSIKVEGRTKGEYYVAMVSRAYRKALDDIKEEKPFDKKLLDELDKVASRRYFSGFLTRGLEDRVPEDEQNFQNLEEGSSRISTQKNLGKVISFNRENNRILFELKNKISLGNTVEVFFPGEFQSKSWIVDKMYHKSSEKDVLSGGIGLVEIEVPFVIPEGSFLSVLN
jgi:U32 family peptidase